VLPASIAKELSQLNELSVTALHFLLTLLLLLCCCAGLTGQVLPASIAKELSQLSKLVAEALHVLLLLALLWLLCRPDWGSAASQHSQGALTAE
jgi:cytochrome b561